MSTFPSPLTSPFLIDDIVNVPLLTVAGIGIPLLSLSVVTVRISGLVCPAVPTAVNYSWLKAPGAFVAVWG
jgi:hypothetical protein